MRVLVTGATGHVGRHVVARLAEAGVQVRALTRNPAAARFPVGVEVVQGDLAQPDSLATALAGIERMYLFPLAASDAGYAHTAAVVAPAVRAGVRRIVTLSSSAVTDGSDTEFHRAVEQAVEEAGVEWTHVRPGEFMLNKLDYWGPSIREADVVRAAYPDAPGVPVHEADVADVAVAALLHDGHHGAAYTLTGPEVLTHRQQVAAIASGIGRNLRFVELTHDQWREEMAKAGWNEELFEYFMGYLREWQQLTPTALPTVEYVTGRRARTLAQWAADHAADLAPRVSSATA